MINPSHHTRDYYRGYIRILNDEKHIEIAYFFDV